MRKKAIALVLIVVAGSIYFIAGRDSDKVAPKASAQEVVLPDAANHLPDSLAYDKTVSKELGQATALAKAWSPDAYLVASSAELSGDLSLDNLAYNYYVFKSRTSSKLGLVDAKLKPLKLNLVDPSALPLATDTVEVPASFWQINLVNALSLADNMGGKTFRLKHLKGYKVNATLAKEEGSILAWYVTYTDTSTNQTENYVVNGSDGTVEESK
jgi:hypothetical protein